MILNLSDIINIIVKYYLKL